MNALADARDVPLETQCLGVPRVADALRSYFRPISIGVVSSKIGEGGKLLETVKWQTFDGVVMPLRPERIENKPEGQRSWVWKALYTDGSVVLATDDVVQVGAERFRVNGRADYSDYGAVPYELCNDFTRR
jgi:hypothetical protein